MEEEDIISTLPDPLLCHILSFLETKHAVATTTLSKRWNNLCHSLPTLYFNTHNITDQDSNYDFNNFVYSVLVSRDATLPIKTFHLDLTYHQPLRLYLHHPIDSITKWVNFVVQRRVEYLTLHLCAMGMPKLPTSILTCTTLVILKLKGFSFRVEEGFSSVVLPSLKTLHLKHIWFTKLPDFIMFLTGCPNLEDLLTLDVRFLVSNKSLTCYEWKTFCLSNLIRADIHCIRFYFPLKAVHNENYLNDMIPTFHNLTQLKLISLDYSWQFLIELLNHCPKLQKFDLDQSDSDKKTWTRKDDKENWVDPDVVPQCLSLHFRTCNLFNFLGLQGELLLTKYILKNARVLQTMRIRNVGQTEIKRLITSYPRASTMCEVTIVNVSIEQVEE